MILIDIIEILNCGVFSVIETRFDTKRIGSRASFAESLDMAEKYVEDKTRVFHQAGRRVQVRWRGEGVKAS